MGRTLPMAEIIKTERLEIKPFSGEDAQALAGLLVNGEIKKTFLLPDFPDREALDKMVDRFQELSCLEDRFVRGIYLQGSLIGFVNDVEIDGDTIELGYVIHPDFWRNGYATEMLDAVVKLLFHRGYQTIKTGAFRENIPSIRVMEKCGMCKCPGEETIEYRGVQHACVYYERKAKDLL